MDYDFITGDFTRLLLSFAAHVRVYCALTVLRISYPILSSLRLAIVKFVKSSNGKRSNLGAQGRGGDQIRPGPGRWVPFLEGWEQQLTQIHKSYKTM